MVPLLTHDGEPSTCHAYTKVRPLYDISHSTLLDQKPWKRPHAPFAGCVTLVAGSVSASREHNERFGNAKARRRLDLIGNSKNERAEIGTTSGLVGVHCSYLPQRYLSA